MKRTRSLAICVAAAALSCWAPSALAGAAGWRGDGSGKYPNARPPLEWGRVAKSVLALRSQAGPPKPGETGRSIPDGVIREWLVLGPVPLPDGFKGRNDFKKEIIAGESQLSPKEGDEVGELQWRKIPLETATLDLRRLFGEKAAGGDAKPGVAYACGRVYSEAGGTLALSVMGFGRDLKLWLNGRLTKPGVDRSSIALARGWNRLLFRTVSPSDKHNPSWYIKPVFFGAAGCDYETRNIAWSCPMPAVGVGSPVVVGDRIFVTADMCNLVCVDKSTGRILWVRSSTYLDAVTDAEKKASPEVFNETDPLSARLKEIDRAFSSDRPPAAEALKEKADLEKKIHRLMKKVDSEKYTMPRGGEAGWAPMTPVTDGRHVWVLFATSTLACYDLDGGLKWAALENNTPGEHGFTSSPVLIGGKIITSLDDKMRAFDAATGRLLWTTVTKPEKGSVTYYKYHGTVCPVRVGGTDCLFTPHGMAVRVSDGRSLHFEFFKHGGQKCASPVFEGGVVCKMGPKGLLMIGLAAPAGDTVRPSSVKEVPIDVKAFPHFYRGTHLASPLVHDGFAYCVNIDGLLTVVDVRKGEVAYQKCLDANVYWRHGGGVMRGGFGSSPALAGKHIYLFGNQGASVVIEPGPKFKQVARNRIEEIAWPKHWREHQEVTLTCPAFDGDRIYVRGEKNLYCIGEK